MLLDIIIRSQPKHRESLPNFLISLLLRTPALFYIKHLATVVFANLSIYSTLFCSTFVHLVTTCSSDLLFVGSKYRAFMSFQELLEWCALLMNERSWVEDSDTCQKLLSDQEMLCFFGRTYFSVVPSAACAANITAVVFCVMD